MVFFLLVFRIFWGFVGTRYALFSNLIKQIAKLPISKNRTNKKDNNSSGENLGHSSQGSLSVLVLLLLLTVQVGTGLFNTDDYTFAPLSGLVNYETRIIIGKIHSFSFDALCFMVGLHILAIIYYRIARRKTLTKSMISGYKSSTHNDGFIRDSKSLVALITVIASALIVYGTINCCADSIPVGEFDF